MQDDLADARLEREIEAVQAQLDALWDVHPVKDRERVQSLLSRLGQLVNARSEAQITRMERDGGLT